MNKLRLFILPYEILISLCLPDKIIGKYIKKNKGKDLYSWYLEERTVGVGTQTVGLVSA